MWCWLFVLCYLIYVLVGLLVCFGCGNDVFVLIGLLVGSLPLGWIFVWLVCDLVLFTVVW